MGRKIEIEKINDQTKCQVTFSKRRTSLIKKANEIAVCCDVDVAFVAFSPSGRITKYSNRKRIKDVIQRYADLPIEMRLNKCSDSLQGRIQQLRHLDHFSGDNSKLHFLDKQIENLELQIKKSDLELQILEANLRDFELNPGEELSLHRLSWCERNLTNSLDRVMAAQIALNTNGTGNFGFSDHMMMQHDPLISTQVGEMLVHNLVQERSFHGMEDEEMFGFDQSKFNLVLDGTHIPVHDSYNTLDSRVNSSLNIEENVILNDHLQAEILPYKMTRSSLWTSRSGDFLEWNTMFFDENLTWLDCLRNENGSDTSYYF